MITKDTNKTTHIVGKHPIIRQYPPGYFADLESYGINHAVYQFGTKYAFTGHKLMIPMYKKNGIVPDRQVLTKPFFEGPHNHPCRDWIGQEVLPQASKGIDFAPDQIRSYVLNAAGGHREAKYTQWKTTLHLVMFYLILIGSKEIHIHGCNLSRDPAPPINAGMQDPEYSKRHTKMIIEAAADFGVEFVWHLTVPK